MDYWMPPTRPDELYHWGMKKGEKADDHKYVVRIEDGVTKSGAPKYRYFYSMAEYKAFKEGGVAQPNNKSTNNPKPTNASVGGASRKESSINNQFNSAAGSSRDEDSLGQKVKAAVDTVKSLADRAQDFLKKIDKSTGMSKKISSLQKTVSKTVGSFLDSIFKKRTVQPKPGLEPVRQYLPKAPDSVSKDPKDYAINKKQVDPNANPNDSSYTDQAIRDNMSKFALTDILKAQFKDSYGLNIQTDEEMQYVVENIEPHATNESYSDIAQRCGLVDETQKGFHPESFDELNKLDYDLDDDVDQYCVNGDNLNKNADAGDVDGNGDGIPDMLNNYGYTNNCAYCTLAYEMRQRGYDVEASSASQLTQNSEDAIESWYEGGEFTHSKTSNPGAIERDILRNNPEGARGQFCMVFENGGGHSVVYEVKGGEVYIRDCQLDKQWKLKDCPYTKAFSRSQPPIYMRTDNLKLTKKSLVGVKNR